MGSIFTVDDDLRALILRVAASLERADLVMEKAILLINQTDAAIARLDRIVAGVQKGLQLPPEGR